MPFPPSEPLTLTRPSISEQRAPLTWREIGLIVLGALSLGITWAVVTEGQHVMREAIVTNQRSLERVLEELDRHVKSPGHAVSMERWEQLSSDREVIHQDIKELRTLILNLQQSQISLRDSLLKDGKK